MRVIKRARRRKEKKIILIAGPNGAGKTTFADSFLAQEAGCPDFLNADSIAKKLSPKNPEAVAIEAGRMMLNQIARRVSRGESFAIETTLSGMSYARQIRDWRKLGYFIKLVFLSLSSADVAVERVRARVIMGGHSIPETVIRRRFDKGIKNFHSIYRRIVNSWILYDNEGDVPRVIAEGDNP